MNPADIARQLMEKDVPDNVFELAARADPAVIAAVLDAVRGTLKADGTPDPAVRNPPVAAFHVLAQHRVKEALPLCLAWLAHDGEGDISTALWAASGRILASLCAGDATLLLRTLQ